MVDGTYKSIGRKEFEYRKSNVIQVIDFVDNYKDAQAYVLRLTKKSAKQKGRF
jgi:hypothetical protein